ncbi:hypothetical protein FRC00_001794 [Tulasnella sp. 408]|nr:hypothetical protein FRC00_001794 [Tulasnella sp. 408]
MVQKNILDKMETFTCLRPLDVTIDQNAESDSEDDGDDGEDEGEDEDEEQAEGGSGDEVEAETDVVETPAPEPDDVEEDKNKLRAKANEFLGSSKDSTRSAEDQISTPLPGETLAMFYSRSKDYWAQKAYASSDNKGKLLRRDGFALAEERYASYKPILEEVEKILAEAGLDEEEIKRHPAPFIDFSSLISSLLSLTATQPFQAPPFIGSEVYPYEGIVRNMKAPLASSHDSPEKELDVLNGAQPTSGKINGRGFVMRTTVAICAVLVLLRAHLPSKFVTTSSRNPASNSIIPGIKEDKAYGWKDDIWPIRPQQPWDISTDFAHPRKLKYDVEEGTWLRLDVSRDGEIVFDMLGM